jgi:hypothetical protein
MKAVNKAFRITLATTLVLSQGTWLAPALASSGSRHQAVTPIAIDELKREYGAGGGGGGSNPTPDPGTGGGSAGYVTGYSSEKTDTVITNQWQTDEGFSEISNQYGTSPTTWSRTLSDECYNQFTGFSVSGDVGPGGVGGGVSIDTSYSCAASSTLSGTLQPKTGVKIYKARVHQNYYNGYRVYKNYSSGSKEYSGNKYYNFSKTWLKYSSVGTQY